MQTVPSGIFELALYLRQLRLERWPGSKLTQAALGRALGGDVPLAPATIASWENRNQPKLPPTDRLLAYAQFFATRRSVQGPLSLIPLDSFTAEEQEEYSRLRDKLLELHALASGTAQAQIPEAPPKSWQFDDDGPMTIICAELPEADLPNMARPGNPNYTKMLSFADLDAMVELFGHVRAENPHMNVFARTAPKVEPEHLSGHLVLVGGVGLNNITLRFLQDSELTSLPVTQREDNEVDPYGEFFIVTANGEEKQHVARWADESFSDLQEDVGLLVRMPNPLNSSRTLTMCNGIHSRGVLGTVLSLADSRLRETNERYIAASFPGKSFGILMRVPVIGGQTMTPDFTNPRTILYQWSIET